MSHWDETFDFVIVGSGGGSMCAALAAKDRGRKPLILEKLDKVGGSTALSGGVWWVPDNPIMKRAGREDSYDKAQTYLKAVFSGFSSRGASPERVDAFLRSGPEMVSYLEKKGMQFHLPRCWPDYYDDLPGGEHLSRSLVAKMFNLKELGDWEMRLNVYPNFDIPLHPDSMSDVLLLKRTWAGKKAAAGVAFRALRDVVMRSRVRGQGAAIQGRMLQLALHNQIPIWTDTAVTELLVEGERVVGVVAMRNGQPVRIRAIDGVLINAGGFARNASMRQAYQRKPISHTWTNANKGDTGEMLEACIELGAATENLDLSIWIATSLMPNGDPAPGTVHRGDILPSMLPLDMSKPGCVLVDSRGQRFVNESGSYMDVGEAMYDKGVAPFWFIMDQANRDRYMWGGKFGVPKEWLSSGFMKKADNIEALAWDCGIDAQGLANTIERFNTFARNGKDLDFNRGGRCYDRWNGDPSNKPNPSLGAVEKGPFYAVAAFPGDVGTFGGVVCDEHARVLREDGSVIDGLYATGNCTSSVLGRFYPGAGGSIAASFVFGYIAALHAAEGDVSARRQAAIEEVQQQPISTD